MVIWSHWPVFHFSMNPVGIHDGRGHSRQNYFCDTVQCFYEEKWTAYNYWHFTLHLHIIFSGRKAKINLHTTPKLTAVIPISCLLPCADPGIYVRGGGGGGRRGPRQSDKKTLRALFVSCCFFLVLGLFYRRQMVNFKEKKSFFKVLEGVQIFPGGGGGELLIPYRNPSNLWFSRGGGSGPPAPPPPSGSALGCDLFSFPVRKMMRSPLRLVLSF